MFPFKRKQRIQAVRAELLHDQLSRMEGVDASPKNVQHHLARRNRLRKRAEGNWNSFRYKFTLTPELEQDARDYCRSVGFDFDAEWRRFNDNNEPSQAATPQQREAEAKWFPNRTDAEPESVWRAFMQKIEMAAIVYRHVKQDPCENNPYMNYPGNAVKATP